MIEIDGSYKEGGGQILRTATLLSAVTGKPCHIVNIRKNRPKPGLRTQHLFGLKALAELCGAKSQDLELGSEEIWFKPEKIRAKPLAVNISTAGSITLILQTLVIPASFANEPIKIVFEGGATETHFSPTMSHLNYVLLPIISRLGYVITIDIKRRGYYPKGGAKVEVNIFPKKESKEEFHLLNRGTLQKVIIRSFTSSYLAKARVAERQAGAAREILQGLGVQFEQDIRYFDTLCPGSSIDIIAKYGNTTLGSNALGKRGKPAEKVGKEAAQNLLEDIEAQACLDRYTADQILPYVALAKGSHRFSVAKLTSHTLTNIWIIERFLKEKFHVRGNIIEC